MNYISVYTYIHIGTYRAIYTYIVMYKHISLSATFYQYDDKEEKVSLFHLSDLKPKILNLLSF